MVRVEWVQAITTIEKQAEEWSVQIGWRTRRVNKKISESLIGTYEAPQLLIFAEPNLYVLDPVAPYPWGTGIVRPRDSALVLHVILVSRR